MRVFQSPTEVFPGEVPPDLGRTVVAIGNFDGVHAGHREILGRAVALARERGWLAAVLTFDPHPARVLAPERAPQLIGTLGQRLRRFEELGIDAVVVAPFSKEFAKLTPEEFARGVLAGYLQAGCVLVGEDFRFGFRQTGDIRELARLGGQLGFEVRPVAAVGDGRERISSTQIRNLVREGRVSRALRLMGAPFALEGQVVHGHGIGKRQTVPTLNLAAENELMPRYGVYVTCARDPESGVKWRSITNVGFRPTFDGTELTVETYLLDPPPAEAPARIEVAFLAWVRGERKFENAEALKSQILRDIGAATRFHRRFARLRVG